MKQEGELQGRVESQTVDRRTVDSVLKATGDKNLYSQLTLFFGGFVGSALISLASGMRRPLPMYFVLAVCGALVVVFFGLWIREARRLDKAVEALESSGSYFKYQASFQQVTAGGTS